eukprot:gene8144-12605_t
MSKSSFHCESPLNCKYLIIRLDHDSTTHTLGEYKEESEALQKLDSLLLHNEKKKINKTQFVIKKVEEIPYFY